MIIKLLIVLPLIMGGSMSVHNVEHLYIQGYISTVEVLDGFNTTIFNKLLDSIHYTLNYTHIAPSGILSYSTPDVLLFFQLIHSILKDNMKLTNLILDVSQRFNNHERIRTRNTNKKKLLKEWLDKNLNFPEEDVYDFVKKIARGKSIGIGEVPTIIKEQIFLLDGKYKIVEKCFKRNDPRTVEWLLKSDYPIELISGEYLTNDFNSDSVDVMKLVLKNNYVSRVANISLFRDDLYVDNQTLLHIAAQVASKQEILKIIKEGADINALDLRGLTPIYKAVEANHLPGVEALMESGADMLLKYGVDGNSIIHLPLELNLIDIFLFFVKKIPPLTFQLTNNNGDSLLHLVAKQPGTRFIEELLKIDLDINAKNNLGDTPLYTASLTGNIEAVQSLINHNAKIDERNYDGFNSLLIVVETKNLDLISLFLETMPTLITSETFMGDTIMHLAVETGEYKIVEYLLEVKDVPVDKKNKALQTPLYKAALNGNEKIVSLLKSKTDLQSANSGINMLHESALICNSRAVQILMRAGISVNSQGLWRNTALHFAASRGCANVVTILLKNGAIIDRRNKNNLTPLHLAALGGHLDAVKVLIEDCADSSASDSLKGKPIDLAIFNNHTTVVQFLQENERYCF